MSWRQWARRESALAELVPEMQRRTRRRVAHYRRDPTPERRHELTQEVAECFGRETAEFFMREGRLPLVRYRLPPWPVEIGEGPRVLALLVYLLVSLLLVIGAATFAPLIGPALSLLAALVLVCSLPLTLPLLARPFRPRDYQERARLADVFAEIVERSS